MRYERIVTWVLLALAVTAYLVFAIPTFLGILSTVA